MKSVIKNENGQWEEVTLAEDKSAWVYAGLSFGLLFVGAATVFGWLFCVG